MNKKNKTILLIDDNQDITDAVELLLEDAGYTVISINNEDYLLHLDENNLPDVILLDLLLSGKDGRDIISLLKNQPKFKHIPIILNSAHPNAKNIWQASGANDFIAKPFDIDALLAIIEKNLH